jgi:hypothetical protein
MITLEGRVIKEVVNKGSKSERSAVLLITGADDGAEARYALRRRDGNAFYDPKLAMLVGKYISCEGQLVGRTYIIRSWNEIDEPGKK